MLSFDNIKSGDVLFFKLRQAGFFSSHSQSIWAKTQYRRVIVEKSNKVHYWVDGEKYRRDQKGKNYMITFLLPDDPDLPKENPSDEEMDTIDALFKKVLSVGMFRVNDFAKIKSLELAASLAERYVQLESEIKDAINSSQQNIAG